MRTENKLSRSTATAARALGAVVAVTAFAFLTIPSNASEPAPIVLAQGQVESGPLPAPSDPYAPSRRYANPRDDGSDSYRPARRSSGDDAYRPAPPASDDSYRAAPRAGGDDSYRAAPRAGGDDAYRPPMPPRYDDGNDSRRDYSRYDERSGPPPRSEHRTFSENEIINTGHKFFGSVSEGLARAVERLFRSQGRPNGYILGEDAGGAFVAGLRYGEGQLYTKDAGVHKVFWQGPSVGYDFGGEGSKTMVLVYNLRDPSDIYRRFGGVEGSAYVVGGVSVQLQTHGHVTLAPIRSGIGLRLGANVGYLKYTRRPTWNPF